MPASRIILGSLVAASIRHGIFTIALPWLILYRTDGLEEMRFDNGFPAAGWVLILLGAVLYLRAFVERLRMTAVVTSIGGTPGTDEASPGSMEGTTSSETILPSESVPRVDTRPIWSEGAHGWSRNPLLLGVLIILLGECLAFESLALLAYLAFYWLWLTLYLVLAEEPALRRTLGSEYASYCRHVPRWFLHFHSRK